MSQARILVALAFVASGCQCGTERSARPLSGGNAQLGERAIYNRGCGACHVIPGVRAARGVVGESLLGFSQRTLIAGDLPNTPDNLVRWLMDPPAVRPATAMPNLGIGTDEARNMAAYLYSLD